jgi:parvulin-like peptidyl-prolyl isomerase
MGYVRRGDLLPEIEKVVFNMKEGEVSDVIRTKVGFHFIKVDEKKAPESVGISEARQSIEQTLWMSKMKEKSKGWIEELRKHAYIAFK